MTDSLISLAEYVRGAAAARLDPGVQARHGQFFTPAKAAALIARLPPIPAGGTLRVLDPGAGSGMLTAALVERLVAERSDARVRVTAVEIDRTVLPFLEETARLCEVWARDRGADVQVEVRCEDVIASFVCSGSTPRVGYDLVIMNPPYAKLAASSGQRRAMASLGWDCPNLYASFLALAVDALSDGGRLVAITPRSFANGPYFSRFRRRLLEAVAIDRLHTFESRSALFADSGVLQENIVFSGTKGGPRGQVSMTASRDHRDVATEYVVDYSALVRPRDPNGFIRITTCAAETAVAERMMSLPASLAALGLQVSTGRVVDFRARENLHETASSSDYPLVYPGNLREGRVAWPRGIGKAQGFTLLSDADRKALMPGGCYVLVKRFSSKEERRRIVAALWDPSRNGEQAVAFENHLNVFHRGGASLDRELGWGICLWLNGSLVDRFFRTFSGHTQVNATDLRSLRFPDERTLRVLARETDVLPSQEELDIIIDRLTAERVAA